jgi:hypothetical protein
MSFDRIVEAIIQEAMARGEFENLSGQGKPIDLTEYFNMPEDIRVAQAMLKNADMVPIELELLQEILSLKEMISSSTDELQKAKYRKILEDKQLLFNLLVERRQRHGKKK